MNDQEGFYKEIVQEAAFGYAYHRIVLDERGTPVDYIFLEVNKLFEKLTGLKASTITGRNVTEVLPAIKEGSMDWIGYYGEVAINGGSHEFTQYSEPLGRYYKVKVFSPERYYFVTLFTDVSDVMEVAEMGTRLLNPGQSTDYSAITDSMRAISQAAYASFNLFDESGRGFTTVALEGVGPVLNEVSKWLGFHPVGRHWDYDPQRMARIKEEDFVTYSGLSELMGGFAPNAVIKKIEHYFNLGRIYVVKVQTPNSILGDFTLFTHKGSMLQNKTVVRVFAKQVGLYLEKKKAELALQREAEANKRATHFYKQVLDSIRDGVSIINTDYRIAEANRVMKQWFSHKLPLEGQICHDVLGGTGIKCEKCPVQQAMETGLPARREIKTRWYTEEKVWEIWAYPVHEPGSSEILAVLKFLKDISETHHHQKRVRKYREQLEMAMDAGEMGFWDWNLDTNAIYFSPRYLAMLGYEPHAFPMHKRTWVELMHPGDRESVLPRIERYVSNAYSYKEEFRMRCNDGSYKWVVAQGKSYEKDDKGKPHRAVGVHQDIHRRKQMEQEKLALANEFRHTMQALDGYVFRYKRITGDRGEFYLSEGKIAEAFGLTTDKVQGKSLNEILTKQTVEQVLPHYKAVLMGDQVHFEFEGKGRWFAVSMAPYNRDEGGRVVELVGNVVDITLRKNQEKELEALNEELTATTDALRQSNEELEDAKDKAEESDRLKSAFLANMSHEIRTPMNAIVGFSSILRKPGISQAKLDQYAQIVSSSSNHLLNIINDIIDISKIDAGQMGVHPAECNISDVMEELYELFLSRMELQEKHKVTLEINLPEQKQWVMTDETRLRQVLMNLLINALKFTEEGTISFGYERRPEELLFYVSDTGIGIPYNRQHKIFERFSQATDKTEKDYGGTGLGLSIAKACVDMLRGEIWLKSEPGKGSVFYFTIAVNLHV